ncbi:MAG: PocR ligand-binding domain-containing protein [Christensenellales bacterium]
MKQLDIQLHEIIAHDEIRRILNSFVLSTGLGAVFHGCDGQYTLAPDNYAIVCPFCSAIQSCPEGSSRCIEFMVKAGAQSAELGECYIARCHAGLIELFAPVVFEEQYIGFVSCGPVLMWDWDEMALEEITKRVRGIPVSREKLMVASQKIPIYNGKNVQASADLLFMVVNSMVSAGMTALKQRRELTRQQAQIAELVFEKKRAEEAVSALERERMSCPYPLNKEKELLGRVRLGDRNRAKAILNEILGEIFLSNAGDINIIKARILELVVVISRAAVEGGASLEKMLGLGYEMVSQLSGIHEFEALCLWVVRQLDAIMDTVYAMRNVRNAKSLGDAMEYIRGHFSENLTLESVARQVFLSPFYLSHLFSEELGVTFVEYLTRVRMEEARKLLTSAERSIIEVANQVGYEDSSYFGKVFKKSVGVTPNQYRRQIQKSTHRQ